MAQGKLTAAGQTTTAVDRCRVLWVLGKLIAHQHVDWLGAAAADLAARSRSRPPAARSGPTSCATAVIVSAVLFWLGGGPRSGWRPLVTTAWGLCRHRHRDRGDGPRPRRVPVVIRGSGRLWRRWSVAVTGIVASMPVGIALALGRRSTIPLIRIFSIAFIEFWRGFR